MVPEAMETIAFKIQLDWFTNDRLESFIGAFNCFGHRSKFIADVDISDFEQIWNLISPEEYMLDGGKVDYDQKWNYKTKSGYAGTFLNRKKNEKKVKHGLLAFYPNIKSHNLGNPDIQLKELSSFKNDLLHGLTLGKF